MFSICVSTGTEPGWSMDIKRMQSATWDELFENKPLALLEKGVVEVERRILRIDDDGKEMPPLVQLQQAA